MSLFVLDTDLLTLYYRSDPVVVRRIDDQPTATLAISVQNQHEEYLVLGS